MNYWEYIRVEELLALQGGFDNDETKVNDDETLFIVVHQIYELWFKLVLRELSTARDIFRQNPVPDIQLATATRRFKRVITIFEQAISHFKVMETLTTRDYLEFRDRLIPASGFQSAQLREIEILLGLDDAIRIPLGREGSYKEALQGRGRQALAGHQARRGSHRRAARASSSSSTSGSRARPSTARRATSRRRASSSRSSPRTARRSKRG
jgi:tryptophan 2,3-dioxygenase